MKVHNLKFVGPNSKNVSGESNKFYRISSEGPNVIIHHGAIGTQGNYIVKPMDSTYMAQEFVRKQVAKKKAKGYK